MSHRKKFIIAVFSCLLVTTGCKKEAQTSKAKPDDEIAAAKTFFNKNIFSGHLTAHLQNFRARQVRSVEWSRSKEVDGANGRVIVVPITYQQSLFVTAAPCGNSLFNLSDLTTLVLYKDSVNNYHYKVYTFLPDSSAIASSSWSSGLILSEDWQGNALENPRRILPGAAQGKTTTSTSTGVEPDYVQTVQVCTEIDGYNYSPDYPDAGFAWSETTCTTYNTFLPPLAGTGSGTGSISNIYGIFPIAPAFTINLPPPGNPIGNISDYFHCFTTGDGGHSFNVTLAVEQPIQGSRTPWTFTRGGVQGSSATGNPFNVGHTWLIFTETTPFGTTTRNVGFYPNSLVSPTSPSAQGVLGDDEGVAYNIALTVSVNSDQFFQMLSYASQGNNQGYLYNLNSNNCTSFALDAMAQGNVAIPASIGHWPGNGQGLDPGDLGEDIRNMSLSANMSRNTTSNYHPNTGTCN